MFQLWFCVLCLKQVQIYILSKNLNSSQFVFIMILMSKCFRLLHKNFLMSQVCCLYLFVCVFQSAGRIFSNFFGIVCTCLTIYPK